MTAAILGTIWGTIGGISGCASRTAHGQQTAGGETGDAGPQGPGGAAGGTSGPIGNGGAPAPGGGGGAPAPGGGGGAPSPADAGSDASALDVGDAPARGCSSPVGCGRPCQTQDDCGGQAVAATIRCIPSSCGGAAGFCLQVDQVCPVFADPRCGCDGKTYGNECDMYRAGVTAQYAGPCSDGPITACDEVTPCGGKTACIDDPRAPCSAGASCPGVCAATVYDACSSTPCQVGFCAAVRQPSCPDGSANCGACVFGNDACSGSADCPAGQLCVPSIGCGLPDAGACVSYCVKL